MEFKISGIVREKETMRSVPGLLVRAFDKDLLFTDVLGNAITSTGGTFSIGYEGKDFKELFERRPDIYLNIYGRATAQDPGRADDQPIYTTKRHVRFNAGHREYFIIEIPREDLGGDAPEEGFVTVPELGEWKGLIDEFIKENPINFQYDPDKGFLTPRLECDSHFGPELGAPDNFIEVGESRMVTVKVTNKGNGISFFTFIGVYEGPGLSYTIPVREFRLCDYKIITINPGETVDVKLRFTRLRSAGRIAGICYDPFLDPRGFNVMEQYHPHNTQVDYGYWNE